MEKTIMDFGYEPEFGGWYPAAMEVQYTATLRDVKQLGNPAKEWVIEHNLDYYDLVFLGEHMLGIDPKEITGEMVVKACLTASWDDASVFFATTFAQLVQSAEQAEATYNHYSEDD